MSAKFELLKSKNFDILGERYRELIHLGAAAEMLFYIEPSSSILRSRLFIEIMIIDYIFKMLNLPEPLENENEENSSEAIDNRGGKNRWIPLGKYIYNQNFEEHIAPDKVEKFKLVHDKGNVAAHKFRSYDPTHALKVLKAIHNITMWFYTDFCNGNPDNVREFEMPAIADQVKHILNLVQEKETASIEEIADHEKKIQAELELFRITSSEIVSAENLDDKNLFLRAANNKARNLQISIEKKSSNRLIEGMLNQAGWKISPEENTDEVTRSQVIYNWHAENGERYADFVLWDDKKPLAIIEIKTTFDSNLTIFYNLQWDAEALDEKFHQWPLYFFTDGEALFFYYDIGRLLCTEMKEFFPKNTLQSLLSIRKTDPNLFTQYLSNQYDQQALWLDIDL